MSIAYLGQCLAVPGGRAKFPTRRDAFRAAVSYAWRNKVFGTHTRLYRCSVCGNFHLDHKD